MCTLDHRFCRGAMGRQHDQSRGLGLGGLGPGPVRHLIRGGFAFAGTAMRDLWLVRGCACLDDVSLDMGWVYN